MWQSGLLIFKNKDIQTSYIYIVCVSIMQMLVLLECTEQPSTKA